MAVYFLRSKHLSRGKGARATRAAAYRAGERIRDERTGETFDYSGRRDVTHKEVVLPEELAGRSDMAWTQDRAVLWNAAEHTGQRCNSRLAREWLVLLPPELTPGQRTDLCTTFARELADRYRCAVDVCIHQPRPGADPRNHHAHLLMTTREVTAEGFGPRTALELGGRERHQLGLGSSREAYLQVRERWALLTNDALRQAGLTTRVDHRSLARQGLDREPGPNLPEKVFYAERRLGARSAAGDAIRARHRQRIDARAKGRGELTRVLAQQKEQLRAAVANRPATAPRRELTPDERNAQRRARYKVRRAREQQDPAAVERVRAARRRAYHAQHRKDPEAFRVRQRQWRAANAKEVNRKQREYRQRRQATAEQLVRNGRSQAPPQPPSPTAEVSAKAWLKFRQQQGPGPTAEDSARAWRALRERQTQATGRPSAGIEEAEPKPRRDRGPDFSL